MSDGHESHQAMLSNVSREQIARQNQLTGSLFGSVFLPSINRKSNVTQMKHLRIIEQCIIAENKREATLATCKSQKQRRKLLRRFQLQRKYERELIDKLTSGADKKPPNAKAGSNADSVPLEQQTRNQSQPSTSVSSAAPEEAEHTCSSDKLIEEPLMEQSVESDLISEDAAVGGVNVLEPQRGGSTEPDSSRTITAPATPKAVEIEAPPTLRVKEFFSIPIDRTPVTDQHGMTPSILRQKPWNLTIDTSTSMNQSAGSAWSLPADHKSSTAQDAPTPANSPVSKQSYLRSPNLAPADTSVQVQIGARAFTLNLPICDPESPTKVPTTTTTTSSKVPPSRLFLDLNATTLGFPSLLMQKYSFLQGASMPHATLNKSSPKRKPRRRRKLKGPNIPTTDTDDSIKSLKEKTSCPRPKSGAATRERSPHSKTTVETSTQAVLDSCSVPTPLRSPSCKTELPSPFKSSLRVSENVYARSRQTDGLHNSRKRELTRGTVDGHVAQIARCSNDVITFDGIKSYAEAREIAMAFEMDKSQHCSTQTAEERMALVLTTASPKAKFTGEESCCIRNLQEVRLTSLTELDIDSGTILRPHSTPNVKLGCLPSLPSPDKSPTGMNSCSKAQSLYHPCVATPLLQSLSPSSCVFNTSYVNADGIRTFVSRDFENKLHLVPLDKLSSLSSPLDAIQALLEPSPSSKPLTARADEQICQHSSLPVLPQAFVPKPSEKMLQEKHELVALEKEQQQEARNRIEMHIQEAVQRAFEQGMRVAHEAQLREQEIKENLQIFQEVTLLMGQLVEAIIEMEAPTRVDMNEQSMLKNNDTLTPRTEIVMTRFVVGIVHCQAMYRGYQSRKRARRLLYQEAAECGVLGAMPGTVQGRSGWYQDPKTLNAYYFSIDQATDKWQLKIMLRCVRLVLTPYQMQHQIFSRISLGSIDGA